MNTSGLLEQLLRAGLSGQGGSSRGAGGMAGGLGDALGGALGGMLGGSNNTSVGAGGLGGLGGLLGGLLGGSGQTGQTSQPGSTQSTSRGGLSMSALASLGMLAYQAYSAWQKNQAQNPQASAPAAAMAMPQTVDMLAGPEVEAHSHAILRALIAASKADGRMDEQEKTLIYAEIAKLTSDPELQDWLDQEVRTPLDATAVAGAANSPEMAAEMYLASALLIGNQEGGERQYLNDLAAALQLEPGLQAQLEAHASPQG
ncbi:tellurite resistance TerB family protein [Pseudomonas sp. EL_65y_Pfl2_R95]|uniref:tellurite resistance TerB family protein n=1 Tax=Pseudomonas sp. EL_65y_Pfl2_R95 TaxID=3088698 RepID=UPI0030D960BA